MKRLHTYRRGIVGGLAGVGVSMWALFLLLGDSPEKVKLSVLSVVCGVVGFLMARLLLPAILKNASRGVEAVFHWGFLGVSTLAILLDIGGFITAFPNGYTPTYWVVAAIVAGIVTTP